MKLPLNLPGVLLTHCVGLPGQGKHSLFFGSLGSGRNCGNLLAIFVSESPFCTVYTQFFSPLPLTAVGLGGTLVGLGGTLVGLGETLVGLGGTIVGLGGTRFGLGVTGVGFGGALQLTLRFSFCPNSQ